MNYKHTRIACYIGSVTQAIINNFLPLLFVMFNTDYDVTYAQLSFIILLNFSVQLLVDIASIKIATKLGTRAATVMAHFFCMVGMLLLSFLPTALPSAFLGICISVIFTAIGGGLIEVLVSPIMDRISVTKGRGHMAFLHSFYCWGQILVVLVSTFAIKFAGSSVWALATACWSVVPFFNAFFFMRVPMIEDAPPEQRIPLKELLSSKLFMLFVLLMLTAGASELIMSQWASTFAEQGLGLSKLEGDILGPCAFAFFMGFGRLMYALLSDKIGIRIVLLSCSVIAVLCYLAASLVDNSIISVLACALCGLGVSVMWPGVLSFASEHFPTGGNPLFGILAMAGDFGCAFGPWITGIIAGEGGLRTALLIATVFPVGSVLILLTRGIKNN